MVSAGGVAAVVRRLLGIVVVLLVGATVWAAPAHADGPIDQSEIVTGVEPGDEGEPIRVFPAGENADYPNVGSVESGSRVIYTPSQPADRTVRSLTLGPLQAPEGCPTSVFAAVEVWEIGATTTFPRRGRSAFPVLVGATARSITWSLEEPMQLEKGHQYEYRLYNVGIPDVGNNVDTQACGNRLRITTYPLLNRPDPNESACVELPEGGGRDHRQPSYPNVIYRVWMNIPSEPDPFTGTTDDLTIPTDICGARRKVGDVVGGNAWGYVTSFASGNKSLFSFRVTSAGAFESEVRSAIFVRQCDDYPSQGVVFHDRVSSYQIIREDNGLWRAAAMHKCSFLQYPPVSGTSTTLNPGFFLAEPDNLGMPAPDGTRGRDEAQVPRLELNPSEAGPGVRDLRELLGITNPANAEIPRCDAGDPVNCATGNFHESFVDMVMTGRGTDLTVAREYNSQAAALGVTGVFGRGWASPFDSRVDVVPGGTAATVTHGNGSTVTFTIDGTSYIPPRWAKSKLSKLANGNFRYTLPSHDVFEYAPSGRLLSATNPNGTTATLTWSSDKLVRIDGGGRTLTFTTNADGTIAAVADGTGRTVAYSYGAGRLSQVRDVLGGVTRFTYDASAQIKSVTNQLAFGIFNTYDTQGRVIRQSDSFGKATTWEYVESSAGSRTKVTDREGVVTMHRFEGLIPVSTTRAYGTGDATTVRQAVNSQGLVTRLVDPQGNATTMRYDAHGNATTRIDAEGRVTTWEYTPNDLPAKQISPSGRVQEFGYDSADNLTSIVIRGPTNRASETRRYDTWGQLLSATDDVTGRTTAYAYDALGNMVRVTSPGGRVTTHDYDDRGFVSKTTLPAGFAPGAVITAHQLSYTRNALGQPLTVTDPLGAVTTYVYDALGNPTSVKDGDGRTTTTTYDRLERVVQRVRADGGISRWEYSAEGNVKAQFDGLNNATRWVYDALAQPVSETDPLARVTRMTYDLAGNVIAVTGPDGEGPRLTYDRTGRLTRATHTTGSPGPIDYAYDLDGNVTSVSGNGDTISTTYDDLGRVTRRAYENGQETRLTWNDGGDLLSIAYPDGVDREAVAGSSLRREAFGTVSYAYDAEGLMSRVTDWAGRAFTFAYDANGNLSKATYPVGSQSFARDRVGRPTAVTSPVGNRAYGYTLGGIQKSWWNVGAGSNTALSVDGALHLTQFGTQGFSFDLAERPTALAEPSGAPVSQAFDAAAQVQSRVSGGSPTTFDFDANGRRLRENVGGSPATTYSYDGLGRLTGASGTTRSGSPFTAGYAYGPDGHRRFASRGGVTEYEVWEDALGDAAPLLTHGRDAYVYGPNGMVLERVSQGGGARFLWQDKIGSVIGATSTSGAVLTKLTYSPWGVRTGGDESVSGVLGFAGQATEAGTDLQYMRARWYDPKTAQFLTRDPLEAQTGQPYLYAAGNPTMFVDPTGLSAWDNLRDAAGGALHGLTMGRYRPGWANSCSFWYFGGGQLGGALDPLKKIRALGNAARMGARVTGIVDKGGESTLVIGRTKTLTTPGRVGENEHTLLPKLTPKLGTRLDVERNLRELRREMARGQRIRDADVPDRTGRWLNMERDALESRGWYELDGYYYPPSK